MGDDYAEDMAARATEGKRRISAREWRAQLAEEQAAATGEDDGEDPAY
jgi:hypothetical protein